MSAIVSNPSTQQLERGQVKLWMVLVGVNHYQDSQIPDLRYCALDCKELAEALTIATQEFQETEIIPLYDGGEKPPNLSEIITSIQQFRFTKPEDTVLFYFSGHGYLDSNNRPILCVADTSLEDLARTGLKLDILLNELRQCKAQRQLVWLDACQEREEQDNRIGQNPTGQILAVLEQQAEQSQDFYAMLSCNKTERSWEIPELKHGLFTYCLIEGLRGKAANAEGKIDADSLFRYVERSSKKFIEYKKNIVDRDDFSKGMGGTLRESSNKLKVNRFPPNASQTPQRIARGGGELIIGVATPATQKKALILDRLAYSEADISLCRILQARGSFEVEYFFGRDKQRRNIQQIIASYLQDESQKTFLLYLTGTIESTDPKIYDLVCNQDIKINLNWLGQQLQNSPVKEIIIIADILIADILDISGTSNSLIDILQPSQDKSLCLIAASTRVPNNNNINLLHQLVSILETAGESEREFWVSELITQLQSNVSLRRHSQTDINLKLWLSGSTEVVEILSVEVQRSYNEIFEIDVCPYKSLKAFTQDDAYFFHGREELIAEIIEKLQSTSFLAVVGASGSGKSSVVRAGVIPELVTEGLCNSWVMFPGDNPLAALAKTLAPNNPDFLEGVLHLGVDSLVEWWRQQPKSISVLVIDQFEELFTLTAETDRVNFLSLILGAITKARDCFKVIITLRSDFLDECLGMSELAPLITKSQVLVPSCRLEDQQYRQIIAQPAQKVGLEVEDGLIAILLGELKEGSLPLLQYALEELWQKRSRGKLTVKDYQQYIGKLGKFLSNKAQETYNNLSEAQQKCAQSIFLSLVFLVKEQDDSNKDTRRRLPVSELRVNKYKDVLDSTLQALIDARLIVVSGEENNLFLVNSKEENISNQNKDKITVEVAHEILLRDWETLKWWLDENREKYRLIRDINQDADKWKQNGKQDGFLLSKGALAKYEDFYVNYADDLSENSNDFIDASIQARDKAEKLAKRRQRQIIGGLTGGIVAISMVAVAALWQLRQATINEINALNNSAETLLASNQQLDALVTGLKAGRRIKNSFLGVDDKTKIKLVGVLQNAFYRVKEFNRLDTDNTRINRVILSYDDRFIVSYGGKTIQIWNIQGELLHTFETQNPISNVAFSPEHQIIALASGEGIVELWNLKGQLLHILDTGNHRTNYDELVLSFITPPVVFSPNGQIVAFANKNKVELWNLEGKILQTLEVPNDYAHINEIVFSPDAQTITAGTENGRIIQWSAEGKLINSNLEAHSRAALKSIFFSVSKNSETIASFGGDRSIKLWNQKGELLQTLQGHTDYVNSAVFSPDGQTIASASGDETIKIWNLQGQLLNTFETGYKLQYIVFSPDGQTIASFGGDKIVQLWNLQGQLLKTLDNHNGFINSVTFAQNGTVITSTRNDGIRLWNLQKKPLNTLDKHTDLVRNITFSPNGQIIASASNDKTIKLWNREGQLLQSLEGHNSYVDRVIFSPNGQLIASFSGDETVKLWNLQGQLIQVFQGHNSWVDNVVFSPDNQTIVSFSRDKIIKLWNQQGQLLQTLEGHTDNVNSVVFSPDSQLIASASNDNTVRLWNLQGDLLHIFDDHTEYVNNVAFSPDSQLIASASSDNTVKLWNLQGDLLHTCEGHTDYVNNVAFSPDGQIIASVSSDKTARLWNRQGQLIDTLVEYNSWIDSVIFSPDSQNIAYHDFNKTVKLWNQQDKFLHDLKSHTDTIRTLKFSQNSRIVASASGDGTIKLWNLQGQLLQTLQGHTDIVSDVVFSPDDKIIASASRDGTIKLWSLDLNDVMSRGCNWARDYLTNNPNVSEEDRKICDGIANE
jgi:WD40 repeat protein